MTKSDEIRAYTERLGLYGQFVICVSVPISTYYVDIKTIGIMRQIL